MELLEYIKKNYKTPNVAVLKTLGASEELIKYLTNTPWNTNMKIVEGLIGGSDEGNGIKSISISPAITTTPALDSLFPIYWDELTEEEKEQGKEIEVTAVNGLPTGELTITITPTPDWYALNRSIWEFGDMGEPITTTVESDSSYEVLQIEAAACNSNTLDPEPTEFVGVNIIINNNGGQ